VGSTPEVSILIAAWNASATLPRAVDSVLSQSGVTFEILIIDDASQDDTLKVAHRYATNFDTITAIENPVNGGPAVARNKGLAMASGRYVTVLDSDDYMDTGRLESLVELAKNHQADLLADDLLRVDEADPDGPRSRLWSQDPLGVQLITLEDFIAGNLTTANGARGEMGFLKPLMRRGFLVEHTLSYDEAMRLGEDYMLYAQMLAHGAQFYLTDPKGYVAVMRAGSLSGRHSTADLGALVTADLALEHEFNLAAPERRVLRRHLTDTKKRWHWMRLIDAVKARDLRGAINCFRGAEVSLFLLRQLAEQTVLRTCRKLGMGNG